MISCAFGAVLIGGLSVPAGVDVQLHNALTKMPSLAVCPLIVDGIPVTVIWESGPGIQPDTVTVIPPPGWTAEPRELRLDEDEDATVAVRPILMG